MASVDELLNGDGGALYSIAAIERAGEELLRSTSAAGNVVFSSMRLREPRKPLTRRQKLRARWWDYRERIVTAYAVLRGRHDCGDW